MERTVVLDDASHRRSVAAAGTTAAPTGPTDGIDITPWAVGGSYLPRRAMLRFAAAAALNMTAISVWCYIDGVWCRIATTANTIADIAFAAAGSTAVPVDIFGTRLAVAYTASASNVTVFAYPLETVLFP